MQTSAFKRAAKEGATEEAGATAGQTILRARGVRASIFNKNTLTSSGLASLDLALGGGFALGTVVCVIEDSPSECHVLLLKHFLAQGLVHGHLSALCSADDDLVRALPTPILPGDENEAGGEKSKPHSSGADILSSSISSSRELREKPSQEHLKIAWRYKESLSVAERQQAAAPPSSVAADYCLRFDLSKTYDASEVLLSAKKIRGDGTSAAIRHLPLWDWGEPAAAKPHVLRSIFHKLANLVDGHAAPSVLSFPATAAPIEDNVCRIALSSLGSPMWWSAPSSTHGENVDDRQGEVKEDSLREVACFLHALKGKVRGTNTVVFATIPQHVAAGAQGPRLLRLADYIIRLDSVARCLCVSVCVRERMCAHIRACRACIYAIVCVLIHTGMQIRCIHLFQSGHPSSTNPEPHKLNPRG